ncbi:hypothetical protein IGB42_02965 [Andreprevotia sp. IGB-42]|uniref:hypothetical protein n=1 Tax=Andreprevotia sp. IGB-42 TaxID=2497473 RepID=UPI00135BAF2B|nr:hypothetical protein [Andreprevotia sp. IGB-42]KAF0812673.1 hypothetical protein IGB42_02965 [Andreprevotia sp. IGB-42]
MKTIIAALIVISAGYAQADTTLLTCNGAGWVTDAQTTNSMEYNYKTESYDKSTSSSTIVHKPFSGAATVELAQNSVRLKFPHDLVPPLSDGRDAWYALNDSFVGDKEITGAVKFNLFNKPKVRIDRMTGQLSVISGFGEFNASCAVVDKAAGPKF